jgi:hypothetical protein
MAATAVTQAAANAKLVILLSNMTVASLRVGHVGERGQRRDRSERALRPPQRTLLTRGRSAASHALVGDRDLGQAANTELASQWLRTSS